MWKYLQVLEFPSLLGENVEIPKCNRRVKLFALQINQLAGKLTDQLATGGPYIAY